MKRKNKIRWLDSEITTCGDTDKKGLIIWFKTKSNKKAVEIANRLIDKINTRTDA